MKHLKNLIHKDYKPQETIPKIVITPGYILGVVLLILIGIAVSILDVLSP